MSSFKMFAGDSKVLEVTVLDGAGAVVDLTGATAARWGLGKSPSGPLVVERSLGDGVSVVDATHGRLDVTIRPADTEGLAGGVYCHEVEVTLADGTLATVFQGVVTIRSTILKAG